MGISISGAERFLLCGHRASSLWIPWVPRVPPWSDAGKARALRAGRSPWQALLLITINDGAAWMPGAAPGRAVGGTNPFPPALPGAGPGPAALLTSLELPAGKCQLSQAGMTATHSGEHSLCSLLGQAGLGAELQDGI